MASTAPKPAKALASPFDRPSPVVRKTPRPAPPSRTPARTRARTKTTAVTGRDVEIGARAVVSAIDRLAERREALRAVVAAARASQLSDAVIHANLVVSGLDQADIDAALA